MHLSFAIKDDYAIVIIYLYEYVNYFLFPDDFFNNLLR